MLNPHEAALESKMERIARIITREYGVSVRIEGSLAYIDLETMTIVIPNLKEKSLGQIQGVIDGFLDHECGHAVYTDGKLITHMKENQPALFEVWNVVEDCWTEREHGSQFPGVKQNIQTLNEAIRVENEKAWPSAGPIPRLLCALGECWRGASVLSDYFTDPLMGELIQLMESEYQDGLTVDTTQGAIELAERILEKISDAAQQQQPQPQPQDGDGQQGDQDQQDQGQQGQGEDQDAQDGDEQVQASPWGKKGGQEQQEGQEESEGGSKEQEQDQGQGDQQEDQSDQGQDPKTRAQQEQAQAAQEELDSENFAPPANAESLVNDLLAKVPYRDKRSDPEEYLIFSEDFDTEVHYTSAQRLAWAEEYGDLREEVAGSIGNMSTALVMALAAEAEARWVGGARRGRRMDKRVFPLWTQGGRDDRIYRQKEQSEDWDTAVSLLWDCSGSMHSNYNPGSKSYLARLAAIAFHEALCRVNIMHEVLGFNTGGGYSSELRQRVEAAMNRGDDIEKYSRTIELDNRMVFVPWGTMDGRAICAINGDHANRDGECVMWAAKRLAARPEARKVLIVGSDGHPNGAEYGYTEKKYLQEVVQQIITAGLEVYAIGIMDEAVKKYYPQWTIIDSAEDLPRVVMQQLGQALFARKGTSYGNIQPIRKPDHRGSSW